MLRKIEFWFVVFFCFTALMFGLSHGLFDR